MIDLRPKTKIKQIVYTSIGDYLPFPKNLLFPLVAKKKKLAADVNPAPDVFKWKDCIAKYAPNPPAVKIGFEDVAMYQYTGGTTGVSKGVMLTHANLSKQIQQLEAWFPAFSRGTEIMLGALPYFHVFGLSVSMNFSDSYGMGPSPGSQAPAGTPVGSNPEFPAHLCPPGAHHVYRHAQPSRSEENRHELY